MKKKLFSLLLALIGAASLSAQYYHFEQLYDVDTDNVEQEAERIIGEDEFNRKKVNLKKSGVVCYFADDTNYQTGIYAEGTCRFGKDKNASYKRVILVNENDLKHAFEKCEEWHKQVADLMKASELSKNFTKEISSVGGYSTAVIGTDKPKMEKPADCNVRFYFVEESLYGVSVKYGLKIVAHEKSQDIHSEVMFLNHAMDNEHLKKEYRAAFRIMNNKIGKSFPTDAFIKASRDEYFKNKNYSSKMEEAQNKLRNIENFLN